MITRLSETRSGGKLLSKKLTRILLYLIVVLGALVMIYPLLWMLSSSFKPEDEIFSNTSLFSSQWMSGNYSDGWSALDYPFTMFFVNSFIICIGAIVGNLISCS